MIDWHCHILPGIDDGARSVDEAVAMARSLVEAGFSAVCCTPHRIRGAYDTAPQRVREAISDLQPRLKAEGIGLELLPGMEYYLDEFFLQEQDLLPLGASRFVLVEAPSQALAEIVRAGLERVMKKGYVPLVAHPERSDVFCGGGRGIFGIKRTAPKAELPRGLLYQANLGSFAGIYGSRVQRRANDLLRRGCYVRLGSDGHNVRNLSAILDGWRSKCRTDQVLRALQDAGGHAGGELHEPSARAFGGGGR